MLKKNGFLLLFFLFAFIAMIFYTGCESEDDGEIPEEALAAAEQMFEFISMVMDSEDLEADFAEVGLTVTVSGTMEEPPYEVTLAAESFTPPEPEGATITDFYFNLIIDDDPWSMDIYWEADATGWIASSILIDAYVSWSSGTPDENPPDQVSGTITIDGKSYNIKDIMDEIEVLDD